MQLELGEGIWVREFRSDDIAELIQHANNENVARNLEDRFPHPYTRQDAEAWLAHVAEQDRPTQFAIATEKEVIGGIGFRIHEDVYRCTAELGYWLSEDYWGTRHLHAGRPGFLPVDLRELSSRAYRVSRLRDESRLVPRSGEGRLHL